MNVAGLGAYGAGGSDDFGALRSQGDGAPCAEIRWLTKAERKCANVLGCELLMSPRIGDKASERLLLPNVAGVIRGLLGHSVTELERRKTVKKIGLDHLAFPGFPKRAGAIGAPAV